MECISANITYAEATKSQTATRLGIANVPTPGALANMRRLGERIFEVVRREVAGNRPLAITSFFRSEDVNAAVGGAATSQHTKGEAIDIDADIFNNGTNRAIFDYIRDNLEFDQLIWEFGTGANPDWVHVSLRGAGNRREVLRAVKQGGRTVYQGM